MNTKLYEIIKSLSDTSRDMRELHTAGALNPLLPLMALERVTQLLTHYHDEFALDAETYKMLLEEAHDHHRACIVDAYKILDIDGSDGEFRYKWVALKMGQVMRELDRYKQDNQRLKSHPMASHTHSVLKGLECPLCDGDGWLPGESPGKRCTRCNGSGRINAV